MELQHDLSGQLGYLFLVLILLLGGAIAALYLVRRFLQHRWVRGGETRSIQVLERTPISPKSTLYLIEVEGRRLLVAESTEEVCPVADLAKFRLDPPIVPKP